jgi:hypothetical protein
MDPDEGGIGDDPAIIIIQNIHHSTISSGVRLRFDREIAPPKF